MTFLLAFLFSICSLHPDSGFKLQNGDLIFQESTDGAVDKAIKGVTGSIEGYHFTHVGIVYIDHNNHVMVLEATPPKVKVTPLHEFLFPDNERKSPPKSVVGRLKSDYRKYIPEALREGLSLVGKDYDDIYDLDNDKYYCSELIYFMFLKANGGQPVFQLNKMTFKSGTTNRILPEWQSYFDKRGVTVPEGKPGINPGAMSQAAVIDIVHYY